MSHCFCVSKQGMNFEGFNSSVEYIVRNHVITSDVLSDINGLLTVLVDDLAHFFIVVVCLIQGRSMVIT